jgi:hypothetical protein
VGARQEIEVWRDGHRGRCRQQGQRQNGAADDSIDEERGDETA